MYLEVQNNNIRITTNLGAELFRVKKKKRWRSRSTEIYVINCGNYVSYFLSPQLITKTNLTNVYSMQVYTSFLYFIFLFIFSPQRLATRNIGDAGLFGKLDTLGLRKNLESLCMLYRILHMDCSEKLSAVHIERSKGYFFKRHFG